MTPRFLFIYLLSIIALLSPRLAHAQITVADTLSTNQLIATLVGSGVDVTNVQVTCDTTFAVRQFDGTNTGLGLGQGLLMSTGRADQAVGPNTLFGTSQNLGEPGYAALDSLVTPLTTQDACVIEFDITPFCDSIGIQYVFASEEYNEFVNTTFNDVFAFFISGPGIATPFPGENIALVPGTATPVAIGNVNNGFAPNGFIAAGPCMNCAFFTDNLNGTDHEYDGYTVPLLAQAAVTPCQTYHIILAIADVADGNFDSGVFLEAGGIGCITPLLSLDATNNTAIGGGVLVEGCVDTGTFVFTLPQPLADTTTFGLTYGGTATMGVDYNMLPDSITIPAGETMYELQIVVNDDVLPELSETILVFYEDTNVCGLVYRDTAEMVILDFPELDPVPDVELCSGDSVPIGVLGAPGLGYLWEPDTGLLDTLSSLTIVSHVNSDFLIDTFQYTLTAIGFPGFCEVSDTNQVLVYPDTLGSITGTDACLGDSTLFTLTSQYSVTCTVFDLGDGAVFSNCPPGYVYAAPGTYFVSVVVENAFGCQDTLHDTVVVFPRPIVDFTVDSVCRGDSTQITLVQPPDPGDVYAWDFGDGSVPVIGVSPAHLYIQPDTQYTVTNVAVNVFGCADTFTETAIVYDLPQAAFVGQDTCAGDLASFTQQAIQGSGAILTYTWEFPAGIPIVTNGPVGSAEFLAGMNMALLYVEDEFGCRDTAQDSVEIFPHPIADFVPDTVCQDQLSTFVDNSTTSQPPINTWIWDFGDTNIDSVANPTHTYATAGTYFVTLVVFDQGGCRDTVTQVSVVNPIPQADFVPDSVCEGLPATFTLTNAPGPGGALQWDFGDMTSSTLVNPIHTYATSGSYPVQLIQVNGVGCSDTTTEVAKVYGNPQAAFTAANECEDESVFFQDQSMEGDTTLQTYLWVFSDNTTLTGPTQDRSFANGGTETVLLVVQDENGCVDSVSEDIVIYTRPTADFLTANGCLNEAVPLTDRSLASQPPIQSWSWDFGDGNTDSVVAPIHQYDTAGTYTVTLIVEDSTGCRDTISQTTTVYPLPETGFSIDPVCDGVPAQFVTNNSPAPPGTTYEWDFGDGASSIQPSPNHLYDGPGTYTVQVVILNGFACADSSQEEISVYQLPQANFGADSACEGEPILFTNLSQEGDFPLSTYNWTFGVPGGGSTDESPSFVYPDFGSQNVTLIVVDSFGCESDTTLPVRIWAKPEVAFVSDTACANADVMFTDQSSTPDGSIITSRIWDFGNGETDQGTQVGTVYEEAGAFTVELLITTEHGCTNSDTQTALSYPLPELAFDFTSVCALDTTYFSERIDIDGSIADDRVQSWTWDWGDGQTSGALTQPGHLYAVAGDYVVSLSASSLRGCSDTLSRIVPVYRLPSVPNLQPDTACFGREAFLGVFPSNPDDVVDWYDSENATSSFLQGRSYVTEPLTESQTYYLQLTTPEGCVGPRYLFTAEVFPDADPDLLSDADVVERPDAIVNLQVPSRIPLDSYLWDFGDGETATQPEPAHTYASAGIYEITVDVVDENGCPYQMTRSIEVKELINISVPTAFSPNGDGMNDEFYIGQNLMRQIDFRIYNRWGREVFGTQNLDFRWNGTLPNGTPVPLGVYVYRLEAQDLDGRTILKGGTITVVR